jgi:DNA-directed RNA polymerase alpha subunit
MFSPVVKATYKIENSRVGQVTDYDKLILRQEKVMFLLKLLKMKIK